MLVEYELEYEPEYEPPDAASWRRKLTSLRKAEYTNCFPRQELLDIL
jgi:hypothetical protein